jgi:phosphoribosylformylglycinamidine cyclo-ligase
MPNRSLTYRDAGVDIDAADRLVSGIAKLAAKTRIPGVLSGVGPFAASFAVPKGMREPVMVSSTDGVGTKLAVAQLLGRHDTIGIDLVAMNANDLVTTGARPLFFLDYFAVGSLRGIDGEAVVRGIAEGCRRAGMALVGGETAEMPGFYKPGEYDLAGFCVGIAERKKMIDGSKVRAGDVVLGLDATGLHSNGYSLARRALRATTKKGLLRRVPELKATVGDALLVPTAIYVKPLLALLAKVDVERPARRDRSRRDAVPSDLRARARGGTSESRRDGPHLQLRRRLHVARKAHRRREDDRPAPSPRRHRACDRHARERPPRRRLQRALSR